MSCGRMHLAALDTLANIWIFTSWMNPYRLVCPELSNTSPETNVAQVEAGSYFVAVLTESGGVYATWPFSGPQRDASFSDDGFEFDTGEIPQTLTIAIVCQPRDVHSRLLTFPNLPDLPALPLAEHTLVESSSPRLVKIAAGNDFLVALTNGGHVLKIDLTGGQHANGLAKLQEKVTAGEVCWEYLPLFSEFNGYNTLPSQVNTLGETPAGRITHITATSQTFVAYSTGPSSIVLMGTKRTTASTPPRFIPSLQNHSIISVVLGENHFAALTSDGQLLTWGKFTFGALGLGDPRYLPLGSPGGFTAETALAASEVARTSPPDVQDPSPVRFDWGEVGMKKRQFCFAAAASERQMAAVVLDFD